MSLWIMYRLYILPKDQYAEVHPSPCWTRGHVTWSKRVTRSSELRVEESRSMAALVKCRALFQPFRSRINVISGVCRSDSVVHAFLTKSAPHCVRLYSSDVTSGDDLIVRYLDGDDSGRALDSEWELVYRIHMQCRQVLCSFSHNAPVFNTQCPYCKKLVFNKYLSNNINIIKYS